MIQIRVGIDAMGGDFAPLEPLKAVKEFLIHPELGITPVVYGHLELLRPILRDLHISESDVEVVHCEQIVEMGEHATKAITQKKDSSITKGTIDLASGHIDAFVGAGNTGAMMVASIYTVKPIEGINRPTITSVLPKVNGSYGLLLDVGANADCKPETINQFGTLGSVFFKNVYSHSGQARVGLLSIGEEREKGNLVTQAAYPLLESNDRIEFVGNVEGRDLFSDKADVVVCDGFVGNIVLKVCEGMYYNLMKRGINDDYLNRFNFKHYGGTPILGINAPVIIGHGISKSDTIEKMFLMAKNVVDSKMIDKIKDAF